MTAVDALGRALDRAIGILAPRAAARRAFHREQLRQYAAAKINLSTGAWSPQNQSVNDLIASSVSVLRARARQLVRDMPAMATAVRRLCEFTIGDGLEMQARVRDGDGRLAKPLNRQIEDVWKRWCDDCDRAGRLHFSEIQQLCARQETEVGEYFVVKYLSRGNTYLPFTLQILEPDQISSLRFEPLPGNEIHQGVEYDPRTGRAVAYHVEDDQKFSRRALRVPADQALLGYETLRPGQLRGVTPLAPAILLAHSLRDYVEAELDSAKLAARYLAFVTTPNPSAAMGAFGAALSPTYATTGGEAKYTMEMGNAIVDFLQSGESVTIAQHNRPGQSFTPFVQWALQTFAATTGVTYELLSGDYSDAAYTGARVARNDMLAGIRVRRGRLLRQLCEPVRREFMRWAVLAGRIDIPDYFSDPAPYLRAVWVDPGMDSLDPMREGRAEIEAVDNLLRSPQEVLLSRGRDPETVLDERAEWEEMLAERELEPKGGTEGIKTNPAEVAEGTGSGDGQQDDAPAGGRARVRRVK